MTVACIGSCLLCLHHLCGALRTAGQRVQLSTTLPCAVLLLPVCWTTMCTHTLLLLTCTNQPHFTHVCAAPPKPEDLCTIMYTSGTTGDPKVSRLAVVLEILRCCCVVLLLPALPSQVGCSSQCSQGQAEDEGAETPAPPLLPSPLLHVLPTTHPLAAHLRLPVPTAAHCRPLARPPPLPRTRRRHARPAPATACPRPPAGCGAHAPQPAVHHRKHGGICGCTRCPPVIRRCLSVLPAASTHL